MADLIKKIKIKKQDGTFTDYIPIGADAANVETSDGESVQLKLNKKPYYYTNVASMKADTKLKAGDMAITLGYYEANDGGGAEYQIVNNSELVDDGGSVHSLTNGLKAKLVVIDNIVNVKQFGAKGDNLNDDGLPIQKAFACDYNVRINEGIYIINERLIVTKDKEIFGDGQERSILIAKKDLDRGFDMFKVSSVNSLELHDFCLSGNIEQNPVGEIYNGIDGIHICDIWSSSNVNIYHMKICDNAYTGIRILRYNADNNPIYNYKITNNTIVNVDCGIITLGDNIDVDNFIIHGNLIKGHNNSEPISFYHTGTVKNVTISNNIIRDKSNAIGVILRPVSSNITIHNNLFDNLSQGIGIQNSANFLNINNNIFRASNNDYFQLITTPTSTNYSITNFEINNNIATNFINNAIELRNCSYGKIQGNVLFGLNSEGNSSIRTAIFISNSSHITCSDNNGYKHNDAPANTVYMYQLSDTCSYITILEEENNSVVDAGIYLANLTSELLNTKIKTNLSIAGNFNSANVGSNTNHLIQKDFLYVVSTPELPYNYKFTRKININLFSNNSLSRLTIYNKVNFEVYELFVYPRNGAKLTLTTDSTNDFGVIWKNDRDITVPTKLSVVYLDNHLYEI